ncbi:LexA family protein [Vibrio alginolyticus]|uniref:LexA family protein n=1 Tax=Vibrio alginolyticus TaxID=663 RepID=UPI00211A5883|nr:S24 family peptidase [Vibrio alginolyticus]EGQ8055460.1 helix-turn-helix domain-containing protein [Vibrio alginolyticus]MCQ9087399.1 helix-turn-helix domain-containing protein [Vibrio alginolyticus]
MATLGLKILTRRKELKITQKELAQKVGVSHVTISQWEKEDTAPKGSNLLKLSEALKVSASDLLDDGLNNVTKLDIQPGRKGEYPLLGKVSAGAFKDAVQSFDLEYLSTTVKCDPNSYWLIVDGHSMTAPQGSGVSFLEGMLILVDPERDYCNGNFVVAYCENKQMATFKKISIEPEGTFLVPLNPDPTYKRINIADEFCEIAGVVVDAKWKLF